MFLDDGIGGHKNLDLAIQSSQFVKQTLQNLGFCWHMKNVIGFRREKSHGLDT